MDDVAVKYFSDIIPKWTNSLTVVEPKTLSYIITDLRTRILAGIRKETFEELLKSAGISCWYFCWRSFATWDVSEKLAMKLGRSNVITKHFRLQLEYKGTRHLPQYGGLPGHSTYTYR